MAKGTKALNPADKARREARKKELKKNKKQRQQVRSAVIEKRDPEQVIADLEKLDRLEFDVDTNPSMSDISYKDKRKRLKEIWSRILDHYQKEDPDRHSKLKKLEVEYEIRHQRTAKEFEAIKAAREIKIEDVFLPPEPNTKILDIADDDPLMSEDVYVTPMTAIVKPPGCPPGVPPDFKLLAESLTIPQMSPMQLLPTSLVTSLPPTNPNTGTTPGGTLAPNRYKYNQKNSQTNSAQRFANKLDRHVQASPSDTNAPSGTTTTKPAVIESKPVIFMAKATRFVPAAVRSRIKDSSKQE